MWSWGVLTVGFGILVFEFFGEGCHFLCEIEIDIIIEIYIGIYIGIGIKMEMNHSDYSER